MQDYLKVRLVSQGKTVCRTVMKRPVPYEIVLPDGKGWLVKYRRRFAIMVGKDDPHIQEVVFCEVEVIDT